ncbi:class I SAM-dependent methyltransferase [Pseudonocardia spinosispora]|uniref:class I SAM-dependent methyltransferase n=1 Tax=Pseudonocardia spinosispora TaxID=103441 RepID=UPI000408590F|nr:class I SAM-dependent methyltransferase [Pseudonocardia spinosispora]
MTSATVPEAFDAVAKGYDRLVGSNPGYHEHLRMSARRMGLANEGEGLRLLDLGCGTGASTAALLSVAPKAKIVAVDASAGMLAVARAKSWPSSVRFVEGRLTTKLEVAEPAKVRGQYDAVFAAYLVRNLPGRDAGLGAIHELLRPGAPLAVHDYSVADSIRARLIWTAVSWGIIIPAGSLVTGSAALYRYLWRSVLRFDGAEEFERRLGAAGFVDQRTQTMPGWQQGIVHTWLARRPRE